MYQQDSFFDLSGWGQVGLAFISLALFGLMVLLAQRLARGFPLFGRLAIGLALFWLFVLISPQIYYMYYRSIIPDLPLQWVIWPPRDLIRPLEMLLFSYRDTLSAHGQGTLGWAVLVSATLSGRNAQKTNS